jgi:CubicO group peptidase (beta-lactamase class C family)
MNFRCQSWFSLAVCLISTGLQVGLAQEKASQVDAGDSVRSNESKREIRLVRATPESQGVSSAAIAKFLRAADEKVNSMHSVMILRHGKVIAEAWWAPEDATKPHVLWSLSKSFTSTAVGLAVEEGKLSIEDRVVGFFPDDLPGEPSENLRKMQVKDLLTMSTGHADEPNVRQSQDWIKSFLAHPLPHPPGTFFRYNTPATFMQSAIVQKVTGKTVVDYLQSRLFDPLGIQPPRWDTNPQGISLGGYGLFLKTEDIAKFGQLYLKNGKWEGKQLIPATWVQQATSKQVSNGDNPSSDWNQGYGFQFWRCRHNAFRGDGKDGQFCVVLPDQDAVVVMTANTTNMQAQLSLVWDHLLEGFHEGAIAEDPKNQEALSGLCKNLRATR